MSGRGAERILLLVEWMARQTEPVSLADAAKALQMPKSSALGLLRALVDMGYAVRHDTHYRLLRLPGEVTAAGKAWGSLLRILDPIVRQAVETTGESGFIAVFEDDLSVRYLNKIMPAREIRYDRDITIARRAWQVSSGLVLLGGLSEPELQAYAMQEVARGTQGKSADEIIAAVRETAAKGAGINRRGVVEGAAGVAAPILGPGGAIVAALNISGPALRIGERIEQTATEVIGYARQASEALKQAGSFAARQPAGPAALAG